jgi:hypothetical protein
VTLEFLFYFSNKKGTKIYHLNNIKLIERERERERKRENKFFYYIAIVIMCVCE